MKKLFIASLVGAIIMLMWSFLSWMVLPIHEKTFTYTPAQDGILKAMADANLETGAYGMPSGATREEAMQAMEANKGKAGALIHYTKADPGMDPSMHLKGFLFFFVTTFAACVLLANNMSGSFFSRWWMVMMVAVIIIFGIHLMHWNYMGHSWNYTRDFILDAALGWGINGLWLAWYMGRR